MIPRYDAGFAATRKWQNKTSSPEATALASTHMPPRRKVLLTNFHRGTGGGHRTYLLSLLKGSLAQEFDLALACPATSSINTQARANGSLVFDQDFPGSARSFFQMVAGMGSLERIHQQFPFDIIHCNGSRDHWIAIYWKTFYRRQVKIIRARHAVKETRNDIIHAWAFNRATDLNIFVSRGMIPLCEPPGKLKLTSVTVITNGVDTDYFQPQKKEANLAAKLGILPADFVIGSNAGLGHHKRTDLMVHALAELPDRANVKLLLLGEERSIANYLYQAQQLGIEKNLVYAGMVDDVRPYLALLDLGFVLSDSIETSSYAAKEMMAMGVPLICTRFSGLPENVDEGKTGFLMTPGDLHDLQKCLRAFLNLVPSDREQMGRRSREKVVEEFSRQRQMELLAQVYREVGSDHSS
jgi:glycosyltransferase involved in cell wall biosynthesis